MSIKKGQIIDIDISGIAFGGKGIAKIDGMVVFVDQAVPSDYAKVLITRKRKNHLEAKIIELLKPSPFRIKPACVYTGYCGGCKWQFLRYDMQLIYKRQHVIESLEHIGSINDITVHPAIPSDPIFEYRNKMEFSCSEKRWLLPEEIPEGGIKSQLPGEIKDNVAAIGLHVPGTFNKVIDIEACMLQPKLGNQILEDLRRIIKTSGLPVYGLKSHTGFWRFLMLRHSVAYDQWMVNLITASENHKIVASTTDFLMEKYPQVVSVVNNITARQAGITVGEYEISLTKINHIRDRIGNYLFDISANSFFQTNTKGVAKLYETVKNYAELTGKETVVDLYSGTGTIAIYLSDAAKEVIGIEIVESAVKDAENNCRINNISNCRFILGDVRKTLSQVEKSPDILIIDPPRAGMHKDVIEQILKMAPRRIVYVSCNPPTLARDLNELKDLYTVLEVQPIDMFPHTHHIEAVAKLVCNEV